MSGLLPDPALGMLLRLKLRGGLRRTWRRIKTPRGAIMTLLGVSLVGLWIAAIMLGGAFGGGGGQTVDPGTLRVGVRLGVFIFLLVSVGGAFVHRGLFIPQGEIERLFAAPLARRDLIRYRLLVSVGRSLLGGTFFALIVSRRLPNPVYGFLGALVAIQILPVINQFLAILAGVVEGRLAKRLKSLGTVMMIAFGLVASAVCYMLFTGTSVKEVPFVSDLLTRIMPATAAEMREGGIAMPAFLDAATMVFEPWARMLTASNGFDFLTWLGICFGLWVIAFEVTTRLPVDFRELSLETAAHTAARLQRVRKGGGAASAKARVGAAWMRVPWVFGRGPSRAVAWRKGTTVLRKARGTLWVSVIVLLFVTLLSTVIGGSAEPASSSRGLGPGGLVVDPADFDVASLGVRLLPSLMIAFLGVLYLSGGLRFDFREDLDRMETMRAWPIRPSRLFMATIMPQVILISGLVLMALALRVAITRDFHTALFGVAAFVPAFAMAWVSLDNALFLFMPVRMTPGQGGMIPNAGRAFLVIFLRMLLLSLVLGLGGSAGFLVHYTVGSFMDVGPEVGLIAACASSWGALLLVDVCLLHFGGFLVKRFDVARDRG